MNARFLLLAPVLLLVACGGGGPELSAAHPLGTLAEIDSILVAKGLQKSERVFTPPEQFDFQELSDLTVWQYQEHPSNSMGVKHWVLVAVDDAGDVKAIGGKFASQNSGFTTSGTKTQVFLAELWEELNGGEPSFTKANRRGVDVDEYLYTRLDTPRVRGYWEKIPNSGVASQSRSIWDMLLLAVK